MQDLIDNGNYTYFSTTKSLCQKCNKLVNAKVVFCEGKVYFLKHCVEHGPSQALISGDVNWYLNALTFLKPGTDPKAHSVENYSGCPESCGLCPEHQQHTCVPIIEITDYCNLKCPICLVKNRNSYFMSFEEFKHILDTLERCEEVVNLVNLSGGEPTLHPEIKKFTQYLATSKVVKASISTHGLTFLKDPDLIKFFRDNNMVISLQLDGFEPQTYKKLRGSDLSEQKKRIIDLLLQYQAPFSITMTLVKDCNEHEIPKLLDVLLSADNALSMMFQPGAYTGFGGGAFNGHDPLNILTIPDVVKLIAKGSDGVLQESDFMPLPCSHPTCFALTYIMKTEGGNFTPIPRIFDLEDYLDIIKNNALMGMGEENLSRIKDSIYKLWTAAGVIPDRENVLKTIKTILKELNALDQGFSPQRFMSINEKHIKSIFIHHFMDAHTFDLARVVKCCQQYPQADGRLMPACVFNNKLR